MLREIFKKYLVGEIESMMWAQQDGEELDKVVLQQQLTEMCSATLNVVAKTAEYMPLRQSRSHQWLSWWINYPKINKI